MPDELANDAEAVAFNIVLYGARNFNYSLARHCLGNAFVKGLVRHIHQFLGQNTTAADRNGSGGIANEPVVNHSDIETYDITELEISHSSQAMDNLLVDRDAHLARKFTIPQKGAASAVMLHARGGEVIHLLGGDARLNKGGNLLEHRAGHRTSRPHCFQISLALENDHFKDSNNLTLNSKF